MNNDTICALATGSGSGAISVVRVSGEATFDVLARVFSKDLHDARPNTIHYGRIVDADGLTIDDVLVAVFRAPHSYTGEDSAEISCHGSTYIVRRILTLLTANGCRLAAPGEYTQRAFLNGKMDLSQAEAVADLIASTNRATHQLALSQMRGGFSSELSQLREQLLQLTSLLELELDFSDHEDLEFADRSELLSLAQHIDERIASLARSFEAGQALKAGIPVAIIGKTNVGKSTLLNRLLKDNRAIVSDVHGTTRDTIEEAMDINGVQFRFIDTAGIRSTADVVERIGIERTYQALTKAHVVLWLIDDNPTDEEFADLCNRLTHQKLIIVSNKTDLPEVRSRLSSADAHRWQALPVAYKIVDISARDNRNIDVLEQTIYDMADLPEFKETDVVVTSARHYDALVRARLSLSRVRDGLSSQLSGDLVAEDLRIVLSDLAEITGQGIITPQETLNSIFSHFCVGK